MTGAQTIGKTRGVIACGHSETAAAAAGVLEDGGNAFDAALAALCTACVAEPVLASLGGGGFMLARSGDGSGHAGREVLHDFFVQTPGNRPPANQIDLYPILADFGSTQQEFHIGRGSIAVPGLVRGLFDIHGELGSLPMARIMEPAIELARRGVRINTLQAYILGVVGKIFTANDACRALYASPDDASRLPHEGETVRFPELADTFETLAREGADLFYKGEIASAIAGDCQLGGGCLSRDDFEAYATLRRAPLLRQYRGWRLATNPPPSSGGMLIAFALALLKGTDISADGFASPHHLQTLAQVMSLTNRARVESRLADVRDEVGADVGAEAAAARMLDGDLLQRYQHEVAGRPRADRGTTHISVIDGDGNACALTVSNGEGSACIVPGTGIMLNNMLGEEDLNAWGLNNWPAGVRLSSMMAPTLADHPDGGIIALGSGGSNRIRTAILQVMVNLLDFDMPMSDAVSAPRLHVEGTGRLDMEPGFVEPGFDEPGFGAAAQQAVLSAFDDAKAPDDVKTWDDLNMFFGGVHGVRFDPTELDRNGGLSGGGDPRRDGVCRIV